MTKNNYIVTARCDGEKKYFTLHNTTVAHLSRIATKVASNLFYTNNVNILSYEIE